MLHRRDVVAALLRERPANLLVVAGLGSSAWDLSAAGDSPANFCFIGAMGQAAPFALGLALARADKRVLLITGDGDCLMALGSLATIANERPPNLCLVVLDNESYGETGGQPTATAGRTRLAGIARGAGFEHSGEITDAGGVAALADIVRNGPGPYFANVKVSPERAPPVFPYSFDGGTAIDRFRAAATD